MHGQSCVWHIDAGWLDGWVVCVCMGGLCKALGEEGGLVSIRANAVATEGPGWLCYIRSHSAVSVSCLAELVRVHLPNCELIWDYVFSLLFIWLSLGVGTTPGYARSLHVCRY